MRSSRSEVESICETGERVCGSLFAQVEVTAVGPHQAIVNVSNNCGCDEIHCLSIVELF